MKDTLKSGLCTSCGVGNLIAARMGYRFFGGKDSLKWIDKSDFIVNPAWHKVFNTVEQRQCISNIALFLMPEAKKQIQSTGYSVKDLARLEYAFETAKLLPGTGNDDTLSRLVAMLDVLFEIHEIPQSQQGYLRQTFINAKAVKQW